MMKNPRTGEDLYIIFHSVHITSSRKEIQRRHAPSMQTLSSLMEFLEKESHRYPSSPTNSNAVSI